MVAVLVVVLRMVEGVCIVFLRMEAGFGRFGDRTDNGSGLSMVVDSRLYRCRNRRGRKQTNPKYATLQNSELSRNYFRWEKDNHVIE